MPKKKHSNVQASQEEYGQAQQFIARYHTIAKALHDSKDQQQAEKTLEDINRLPEASQIALMKQLAKEANTDAADVLSAINLLSPNKNMRKEARRGLIQLEGNRVYPVWESPVATSSAIQTIESAAQRASETSSVQPRFWKGFYSDTFDAGEIQLLLIWEQGNGYRDVRVMGFLLEFWRDGVKDFFTQVESKRSFESFLSRTQSSQNVPLVNCSLAKGRKLLLDALEVNEKSHTRPYKDYRLNTSLINQFILNNPDIEDEADLDDDDYYDGDDEDDYEEIDESHFIEDHPPEYITASFVELWLGGKFELAYSLLTRDSSIREGLPLEEWVERRQAWFDLMHPERFLPYYAQLMEPPKTSLWLPNRFKGSSLSDTQQCEAYWSIQLSNSPLQASLPELPEATCVCRETGRQWFSATFTLAREQDKWRIQHIADRGRELLMMPAAEFDKQFTANEKRTKDITGKHKPSDPDALNYLPDVLTLTEQMLTFVDIQFKRRPLVEQSNLEPGATVTEMLGDYEHTLAYLEQLEQLFPEKRAEYLAEHAHILMNYAVAESDDNEERGQHFIERAIEVMRESIQLQDNAEKRLTLANMLREAHADLDEARLLAHSASAELIDPKRQSVVENTLGNIDYEQKRYAEALVHFQRSLELEPESAIPYLNMAHAHEQLGHIDDAIAFYKQAVQKEPQDEKTYTLLSNLYLDQNQPEKAVQIMEDAVRNNPDSLELRLMMATIYRDTYHYDQAERVLREMGQRWPETAETTQEMLQSLKQFKKNAARSGLLPTGSTREANAPIKFSGKKKRR